eukprot:m.249015 g.249015  ORF g.249015 m.249015 type:complete len:137 (-) comp15425_c0_seq4:2261-2671(-)
MSAPSISTHPQAHDGHTFAFHVDIASTDPLHLRLLLHERTHHRSTVLNCARHGGGLHTRCNVDSIAKQTISWSCFAHWTSQAKVCQIECMSSWPTSPTKAAQYDPYMNSTCRFTSLFKLWCTPSLSGTLTHPTAAA